VDWVERERMRLQIETEASQRFPGAVQAVYVLTRPRLLSGPRPSDPLIVKAGQLVIRVLIRKAGPGSQERTLRAFWQAHRPEMRQFRDDLLEQFPHLLRIQFTMTEPRDPDPQEPASITMLVNPIRRQPSEDGSAGGSGGPAS
jgi:hypothetical protein